VDEYYLSGSYGELAEQLRLLRCPNFGDLLVSIIFRASLDQPLLLVVNDQYKLAYTRSLPSSPLTGAAQVSSQNNNRSRHMREYNPQSYEADRVKDHFARGYSTGSASLNATP
jgi:hypothetical protein